jgi:1,4-dihydroxy-2-naphthoate octaprenyltransferase
MVRTTGWLKPYGDFLRLTRPVFLLGGFLLFGLGSILAWYDGYSIRIWPYILGQSIVTVTQLSAQYANEYYDIETDRLNHARRTWFSGGSGVLAKETLSPRLAYAAMQFTSVLGLLLSASAALLSPLVSLVGLAAVVISRQYSAPPLRLVGSGWGEALASVVVALLVPVTGFAIHSNHITPVVIYTCFPLMLIHAAMLIGFEFPDFDADQTSGKRTLAVRIGKIRAAQVHNLLLALAFTIVIFLGYWVFPGIWLILLALPLAAIQVIQVFQYARSIHHRDRLLTLGSVGLFTLSSALALFGFLLI